MTKRLLHMGLALAVAAALSACGGDDGDAPAAQSTSNTPAPAAPGTSIAGVPSSALQSVTGLVAFLSQLIGQSNDTSEPIALGDAVLPTSDTAEPSALN